MFGRSTAHIIGQIDKATGHVYSVGCFSEPCPTTTQGVVTFEILGVEASGDDVDYSTAKRAACREFWHHPRHAWARRWADQNLREAKP